MNRRDSGDEAAVVSQVETTVKRKDITKRCSVHVPADVDMVGGSGEPCKGSDWAMLHLHLVRVTRVSSTSGSVCACDECAHNLSNTVTEMESRSIVASDEERDPASGHSWCEACE